MTTNLFGCGGEGSVVGGGDVNAVCPISVRKQLIVLESQHKQITVTFQFSLKRESLEIGTLYFLYITQHLDEIPSAVCPRQTSTVCNTYFHAVVVYNTITLII